mmetsp:Transcript_123933/g.174831  ORF Transcript_123933/g.174831 Transcript_123933/m.174831 type:complete len:384 (+) Transcript_123933:233-1384(+)
MAASDGTTLGVDLVVGDTELLLAVKSLSGESLVQLVDVDIVDLQTGIVQSLGDGISWADTHNLGGNTSDGISDPLGGNGKTKLFSGGSSSDQDDGGTIGSLRRVTGGGDTILLEGGLELAELLQVGLSETLILGKGNILGGLVTFLILDLDLSLDGDDLILEVAVLLSVDGLVHGVQTELITLLSGDTELRSNVLRGDTHRHHAISGVLVLEDVVVEGVSGRDQTFHLELRHILEATSDTNVDDAILDLGGDDRASLQTRRAQSVGGVDGGGVRDTSQELTHSGDHETGTRLEDIAQADILDVLTLKTSLLHKTLQHISDELLRGGVLKTTSSVLAHGGSDGSADNDIISTLLANDGVGSGNTSSLVGLQMVSNKLNSFHCEI